jgi:cytochrome c oxidase assembly protein subunit 15
MVGAPALSRHRPPLLAIATMTGAAFLTVLSGGFVAGLDAGFIYNTFPLMEGRLVPDGYWSIPGWRNVFENPVAVQLHHRILGLGTAVVVLGVWIVGERRPPAPRLRLLLRIAAGVVLVQVSLGVVTLVQAVPPATAVLHQLGGVALFAVLLLATEVAWAPSTRRHS